MQHFDRVGDHPRLPIFALKVWRVKKGESHHVRILSHAYGGFMTHYAKRRSWYCPGKDCPHIFHKNGSNWKGYAAVEVYDQLMKKWKPECLEITENLELDFRGRFGRGQVWILSCPNDEKKENPPVSGELLEQFDPDTFPQPFDIIPPIRTCYHHTITDFSVKNPMPDRVILTFSDGLPPKDLREQEEKIAAAAERERDELARSMKQKVASLTDNQYRKMTEFEKEVMRCAGYVPKTSDNLNGTHAH